VDHDVLLGLRKPPLLEQSHDQRPDLPRRGWFLDWLTLWFRVVLGFNRVQPEARTRLACCSYWASARAGGRPSDGICNDQPGLHPFHPRRRRGGFADETVPEGRDSRRPLPPHRPPLVLWTPHALPWQQWRIRKAGNDTVKIISEHGGLALTTDGTPSDGSWTWLENDRNLDSQRWRLSPTPDKVAFIIETQWSAYALDARTDTQLPAAGEYGSIGDPTPPILWSTHLESWQQWLVVRVPLT
jgi:hypothetical protein